MKKIAVMLADGFEEIEALTVVDVLRRAGMTCNTVGVTGATVTGSHGIPVIADMTIADSIADYDMIVLPGGLPGATNLRDCEQVIAYVKAFNEDPDKFVAAICAAPMCFAKAGIATGRTITSYPDDEYRALFKDANYIEDLVAVDGHMITSRGPATTLEFAFTLLEALGGDSAGLREGMQYNRLLS